MNKKKIVLVFLMILFVLMFCVSVVLIVKEQVERQTDQDNFDKLNQLIQTDIDTETENNVHIVQEGEDATGVTIEPMEHERNLSLLIQENSECIGWIYIENTRINYPIMHTPAEPEKYLRRNFYGEYSVSGVPFMDGANSMVDQHIIMYGHNMRNDTMFADLIEYTDPEFYKEHSEVEFETIEGVRTYRIFAVALIQATDNWYFDSWSEDEESFNDKISYIQGCSLYDTGVRPKYGGQVLTLSTCYGNDDDARLVVVAIEQQ